RLVEFRLARVTLLQACKEMVDRFDHGRHLTKRIGLIGFFSNVPRSNRTGIGRNVVFLKLFGAFYISVYKASA
ncbi:hypothetical protein ABFV62_27190, partial [Pseudomonas syringae]|uniref:hypothetical protein n=1 Tax=Pseudomonas syringae TaxID=317 RepID=UPI0034D45AF1